MQGPHYTAVAEAASPVLVPRQVLCCLCFCAVSTGEGSPALVSPPGRYLCLKLASSVVLHYVFSSETTWVRWQAHVCHKDIFTLQRNWGTFNSKNSCISTTAFVCSWNILNAPSGPLNWCRQFWLVGKRSCQYKYQCFTRSFQGLWNYIFWGGPYFGVLALVCLGGMRALHWLLCPGQEVLQALHLSCSVGALSSLRWLCWWARMHGLWALLLFLRASRKMDCNLVSSPSWKRRAGGGRRYRTVLSCRKTKCQLFVFSKLAEK